MLVMAPRAIVAYMDFVENYYWRITDQLFLDPDMEQLQPNLRENISDKLRTFYLLAMKQKFSEFSATLADRDYADAAKPMKCAPEDGALKSAAVQDVFNMVYQHIDTIQGMNDSAFLNDGFEKLAECIKEHNE